MRRSTLRMMLMAIILVALSASLFAQQTGSIVGTVADKTGAVVPNAEVTLTNTTTKDIRHANTNGEGFFAFSGTVVGDYSIKVQAQGFKPAEQTGVHLSPGDRRNVAVALAVANTSEQVTVEATASEVQIVDSGDRASTLSAKEIKNLALQGRDVTELVRTLPGFSMNTSMSNGYQNKTSYDTQITTIGSAVGRGFTANGTVDRSGAADLVSDGAHILDPGCACNATQTINADMVQEVKVTTTAYGADSVTGPVVVSAVSKSGSSEYHGGVYLHFRDSAMNSTDYNVKQNKLDKPQDRYWYPGGQFGGPVPFTNKKLLFFSGYEYYNQSFPEGMTNGIIKAQVPTLSMRNGLFDPNLPDNKALCSVITSDPMNKDRCQPITSIHTMDGYVGNIINSDISKYIAPGAKVLLGLIPAPNHTPTAGATYNYVAPLLNSNNGYMFHTRADYNISDSTKLYVSFNQQHENYGDPMMRWWVAGDSIPYAGDVSSSTMSRTIAGNLVKVFNSTTTNEFVANLSYMNSPRTLGNKGAVDKKATKYPYQFPSTSPILPSVINSWWNTDFGIPMLLDTGRVDYFARKMQPSLSDNFTKVVGTHTVKAGVSWLRSGNRESGVGQGDGPNGTLAFGPIDDNTGPVGEDGQPTLIASAHDPVVNFLLDRVAGFSYAPKTVADVKGTSWGFYAMDEWKTNKRLTLTLGMRVTHDSPWEDATGKYGEPVFTDAWYKADVANGVTFLPGMRWNARDKSIPLSGRTVDSLFYAPRFGLAYDVFGTGKTVLRGGFGAYYYRDGLQGSPGVGGPMGGTSCGLNQNSAFLSQISSTTVPCASTGGGVTSANAADPTDHSEPLTYTYNFTVSHHMPLNSLLEIAYSGSQSTNLINPLQDINVMSIGAFMKPDPNPRSSSYGLYIPISKINNDDGLKQDFRPYTQYNKLNVLRHGAWANYNALQLSWVKQSGAVTYNLNYTWSKTLGIGPTVDPLNIHNDYGIVSQDRSHVFNASYSYEVGNRFKNKFGAIALNGWMISGITGLQSGAPLQPSNSANLNFNGTNTVAGNNTVNKTYYLGVADGKDGTGYSLMPVLTCDPTSGLKNGQYFNPNCFALPSAPEFDANGVLTKLGGQGQYQWPYLRGPAYFTSDLSVSRTIKITERQNAQIKVTALNFLNHPLKSFDQNNNNNIRLNYTNGVLDKLGNNSDGSVAWQLGVPNEKFGRRVLELTLKYNF